MNDIVCPNCGESYYAEKYSTRTAVYYPAIWKDGVNQNPDGNVTTTYCECINCHYAFYYKVQYGKVIETVLEGKIIPVPTIDTPINAEHLLDEAVINADYINMKPSYDFSHAIKANSKQLRDAEIVRLEQQIKSLQDQLAEVKANPEWRQQVML